MISAIQHFSYCPRQCALIHREQIFTENLFTLQGKFAHERVDEQRHEVEQEVKRITSLRVWSDELKITGICDLVDQPVSVEYKFGRIKKAQVHDELQLCAQAMCLEERFQVSVPKGVIYHSSSNKRRTVIFSNWHRDEVRKIIKQVQRMLTETQLPQAVNDKRCINCSLQEACMPILTSGRKQYNWVQELLSEEKT